MGRGETPPDLPLPARLETATADPFNLNTGLTSSLFNGHTTVGDWTRTDSSPWSRGMAQVTGDQIEALILI